MDKADIANPRRWKGVAGRRAQRAGFDIVTVYAAHGLSILDDFLARRHNTRSDEYDGARAPGTIAMAVDAGHGYAENSTPPQSATPCRLDGS